MLVRFRYGCPPLDAWNDASNAFESMRPRNNAHRDQMSPVHLSNRRSQLLAPLLRHLLPRPSLQVQCDTLCMRWLLSR